MADENLKWMFELYDAVSNPAAKISASLKSIHVAMGQGKSFTAAFGNTMKAQTPALFSFGTALGGWFTVASTVAGAIGTVADLVFDVGKTALTAGFEFAEFGLDALAFKESTLASFELILGTKKEAKKMFEEAADFARITPFETEDVVTSFKQLLGAGFSKDEAKIAFQGIGDVAAASGFDPTVAPRLTLAFAQIRAAGHLMGQDLHQILNATGAAGIGMTDIYGAIAKNMGVKVTEVARMQAAGLIDSKTAIFSIFEAIKNKTGELGTVMLKQGETIKGLMSTLRSVKKDFFQALDLDNLPGLTAFKGFIQNLVKLFDVKSGTGMKIVAFVRDIVNDVGGMFRGLGGKEGFAVLEETLDKAIFWLREFWNDAMLVKDAIVDLWVASEPLRSALSDAFGTSNLTVFRNEIYLLTVAINGMAMALQGMGLVLNVGMGINEALMTGHSVGEGFQLGLMESTPGAMEAVRALHEQSTAEMRDGLQVHSPSGVFEEIGLNTALGFTAGVQGGLSGALAAVGSLAGMRPDAPGAAAGGGRGNVSITVPVTVHVGEGGDAEGIASELRRILPSAIAQAFEGMAIESGMGEAP